MSTLPRRLTRIASRAWWPGVVLLTALCLAADADARVGGGHSFSSGGGGSGGGSYGGGGGGGGGELVYLLLQLVFRYPMVGIPLVLVLIGVAWYAQTQQAAHGPRHAHTTVDSDGHGHTSVRHGRRRGRTGWEALAARDAGLSEPVFQDFVQLVFRRAYEALDGARFAPLLPFFDTRAAEALTAGNAGVTAVSEVVIAASPVVNVRRADGEDRIDVAFRSSRVEVRDGAPRRVYVEERWVFRRAIGAVSLPPDDVQRLGCPSCGAAVAVDPLGRCTNCGTPITAGQLQWQAIAVDVQVRRPVEPPEIGRVAGGEEPGYAMPSVVDPDLQTALRAFQGRHPDFDAATWERRVHHVFEALQAAWDADRWQDARPYTTDAAWNTLGFWLTAYRAGGLHNRITDVRIVRMQVVKVAVDAWYEAITVRFWAACKDWTEDTTSGRVVGGNATAERRFSEYWTFLRAIGTGDASGDPAACPSCGAPLDRVNAAGVCGYCDAVITTGRFDWVLSRIDQPEVYQG
ncbi:MAG: Tim44 domain-containing protein [Alphaproteobacteria bacterium]|nr:Tim44 domain-containing protein [Alphaproteobacteria bacterium]